MDGGWLLLLAIGMRSPLARPFAVLLLASWLLSYFVIMEGGRGVEAYAVSLAFDLWAMGCGAGFIAGDRATRRAWWPVAVVALWLAWVSVQGVYWWNYARGVDLGGLAYHAGRWIFTAQTAILAAAGAWCFWLEASGAPAFLRRMERV